MEPKRLSSKTFLFSRMVPCLFVTEDTITVTTMVVEPKIEPTDRVITSEQCLDIIRTPIELKFDNFKTPNYENFQNTVIKYSDFPGVKSPNFISEDAPDVYLRLSIKSTFSHIATGNIPNPVEYGVLQPPPKNTIRNIAVYLKIISADGKVYSSSKLSSLPELKVVPSIIFKFTDSDSNFLNTDFLLMYSEGGYYCNLELEERVFGILKDNAYDGIIADQPVLDIMNSATTET